MASNDFRKKLMSLQGNLLNYAFMLTSNRQMARELVEHTTEVALERWADAADDAMLKGWAFSVMRGVFASEYARRKPARAVDADVYSIRLTDVSATVYARPEGTHRSADVNRALETFTEDYRKAAELYFAGYSVAEIASAMSLPASVVKSRVAYCRTRLRVILSA